MLFRSNNRPVPITDLRPDLPPALVAVMDKLMATKPQERYQTGNEASEALSALLRPRKAGLAAARPEPAAVATSPEPAPPPKVVTVRPEYPGWFRPLASLAESRPGIALTCVLATIASAVAVGFVLGRLLR